MAKVPQKFIDGHRLLATEIKTRCDMPSRLDERMERRSRINIADRKNAVTSGYYDGRLDCVKRAGRQSHAW
jgi:hypothetical protein